MQQTATATYDYTHQNPRSWESDLNGLSQAGHLAVRVSVWWGEHERLKGLSDFDSLPRLRLAKFIELAISKNLQLSLSIGFRSSRKAFPDWVQESKSYSLVPTPVWRHHAALFSLERLPSLFDPEVQERFIEFMGDLSSLTTPYLDSAQVDMDLSIFEMDQNLMAQSLYLDCLQVRYGQIEKFNQTFQSNYTRWDLSILENGLRALIERRSWMVAYDYHWCRKLLLDRLRLRISEFVPPRVGSASQFPKFLMWLDGTQLENNGTEWIPLAPSQKIFRPFLSAYRTVSLIKSQADAIGLASIVARPCESVELTNVQKLIVVAGRYLSRKHWDLLERFIREGGTVIFASGLPRYDENLNALSWEAKHLGSLSPIVLDGTKFFTRAIEKGKCIYPQEELTVEGPYWETLKKMVEADR